MSDARSVRTRRAEEFAASRLASHAKDSLDAAWTEAEAALPEGWRFGVSPYHPNGWQAFAYDIYQVPEYGQTDHSTGAIYGPTPTLALRALTARLREQT